MNKSDDSTLAKKKVKFFSSINNRLLWSIVIIVVMLLLLVMINVRSNLQSGLSKYFQNQMNTKKVQLMEEIENQKNQVMQEANFLAADFSGKKWQMYYKKELSFESVINKMKEQFQSDGYVVMDRDYKPIVQNLNYSFIISAPIQDKILSGGEYQGYMKLGSDILILCGAPVLDEKQNVQASLFAIKKISSKDFALKISHLTDCKFTIFTGYERYVTTLEGMTGTTIDDKSIIDQATYGTDYIHQKRINGTDYLCIYTPFKDTDGQTLTVVFLGLEVSVMERLIVDIFFKVLPSGVGFALLILLLFYFVTFRPNLIKPVKALGKAVAVLNTDEADLTLRLPVNEKRGSEFDYICSDVNAFIERLYNIINRLVLAQKQLLEVVENLSMNSEASAGAISQIMTNIEDVRHRCENQSQSVTNTSVVLSDSGTEVDMLTKLIDEETLGINNSSASIEEMLANIRSVSENVAKLAKGFYELSERVTDGQTKLDRVSQSVVQIEEQSASLNDANAIISQISEQTNLLAMNAAIEAAHAGEAGKGFSVVADEIRKLAEDSAAQTKKIADDLKEIQGTISTVVNDTQESAASFTQIVEDITYTNTIMTQISSAMEEQEEASKQIFDSLSDMKNQSMEVDTRSKVLEQGVQKVSSEMETVTRISETILGSMDEMTKGAKEINESAQNVQSLSQTTKETSGVIDGLLKQFKLE